ncbi:MAG: protein translocase subunit SecF, partial [Patescibacteria group bacterium]
QEQLTQVGNIEKVSYPIKSWKYGVIGVIALLHDILITIGVFAVLGKFLNIEVDMLFITALLTILGYSINDTIVIYDRIRENVLKINGDFTSIVDKSINETIARSINTTVTTLLSLIAVFLFGGDSIKMFALSLIVGITLGAYSSIFIASPLLVTLHNFENKKISK